MSDLAGTEVVVIGGSSGIGLRVAELAAGAGATVTVGGRSAGRLKGLPFRTIPVDAHEDHSLAAFFGQLGRFDHLVSTIGTPMSGGFLSAPLSEIRRTIESKFFANLMIARLAAPKLRDGGSITFTAGTGGRAQDAAGSYVGNLGIRALAEGLAVELAPRARVNAVAPTWTDTPLWNSLPTAEREATKAGFARTIPLGRTATVDELAHAYVFLMTSGFVTGQQVAVDGGIMLGS